MLAIVDVEEGWQLLTRLVELDIPSDATELIGLPVEVRFIPEGRTPFRTMPAFGPRAQSKEQSS